MQTIGWREWVKLPDLNIKLKAKIDTGAKTSALHAFQLDFFTEGNKNKVRFAIHPKQKSQEIVVECVAEVQEMRWVTDSGGHKEYRPVILTPVVVGGKSWPIEITLTSRDDMRFRMLLGRSALKHHFVVDASRSFLFRKKHSHAHSGFIS